jgi:hypothetical protein
LVTLQDSILISIENVPSTVSFVEAKYIPVTVSIPENLVNQFTLDTARAVLNLKNFKRGAARILPRVKGLPPHTKVIKIDSVSIRL